MSIDYTNEFYTLLETDLSEAMQVRISQLEEDSYTYMISVGIAQVASGGLLALSLPLSLTPFVPVVATIGGGAFFYTLFRDFFTTGKVLSAPYYRVSFGQQMQMLSALQLKKMYGDHYVLEKDKDHDVTASLSKKAVVEYRMLINYSDLVIETLETVAPDKRARKYQFLVSEHTRGKFPSKPQIEALNQQNQPTVLQTPPSTPNLSASTPTPLPAPSSLTTEDVAKLRMEKKVVADEQPSTEPTALVQVYASKPEPEPEKELKPEQETIQLTTVKYIDADSYTNATLPTEKPSPEPWKDVPEKPNTPDAPPCGDKGQEPSEHIESAEDETQEISLMKGSFEPNSVCSYVPPTPVNSTRTFDWIDEIEEDDPECRHISNYLDLLLMRSLLLVGGQGSGKTTLAKYLMDQKILRGHEVLVINPHGTRGQWGDQVKIVGGGRNYFQIEMFMRGYIDELNSRYEQLHQSGMDEDSFIRYLLEQGKIVSPICEEMSSWQSNLDKELMHKFVMTALTESRKVVMPTIQIAHSRNLSFVGLKEGADLRDAGLVQVVLDPPIIGEGGRPISSGKATIYIPGQDPIRVKFDKNTPPVQPPTPPVQLAEPKPVFETTRPTLLLEDQPKQEVEEEIEIPDDDFQPIIEFVKKKKAPVRASELIAGNRYLRGKYKDTEAVNQLFTQAEELGYGFTRWSGKVLEFFVI